MTHQNADIIVLDTNGAGNIFPLSQTTDSQLRGCELEAYCVLDFLMDTYVADLPKKGKELQPEGESSMAPKRCGRPRNVCVRYLESYPKANVSCRVVRSKGHNVLPNIVGPFFVTNEDPAMYPFYCTSMLMLLKP